MSGPTGAQEKPEPRHWTLASDDTVERLRAALYDRTGRVWVVRMSRTLACHGAQVSLMSYRPQHQPMLLRAELLLPLPDGDTVRHVLEPRPHPFSYKDFYALAHDIFVESSAVYDRLDEKHKGIARFCVSRRLAPFQPLETP